MKLIKNIQLSIVCCVNPYGFCSRFYIGQAIYSRAAAILLLTAWLILSANVTKAQPPAVVDTSQIKVGTEESDILGMEDQMPIYKYGGLTGMMKFIDKNIKQPEGEHIYGVVYVTCTIDTSGKVINTEILRGIHPAANADALRVVKLLEFIPGIQNGRNITQKQIIPIKFK